MNEWNTEGKPAGLKRNRFLDAVVTTLKYNKITIDHAIYIKFFYDGIISYLTVSAYYVLNSTTNYTPFTELRRAALSLANQSSSIMTDTCTRNTNF